MIKKVLQLIFPSIIEELQQEAVTEYYTEENIRHLDMAERGTPYYFYGEKNEDGLQEGYKYTPIKLGLVHIYNKRPKTNNTNAWNKE
jgi:hypothetical protein